MRLMRYILLSLPLLAGVACVRKPAAVAVSPTASLHETEQWITEWLPLLAAGTFPVWASVTRKAIRDVRVERCELHYIEFLDHEFGPGSSYMVDVNLAEVSSIRVHKHVIFEDLTAITLLRRDNEPVEIVAFSSANELANALRRLWSLCVEPPAAPPRL